MRKGNEGFEGLICSQLPLEKWESWGLTHAIWFQSPTSKYSALSEGFTKKQPFRTVSIQRKNGRHFRVKHSNISQIPSINFILAQFNHITQ